MRKFIFVGLGIFAFGNVWGSQEMTLRELHSLVSKSPQALASEAQIKQAQAQVKEASGLFFPSATWSHGYTLTNDPVGVFMGKLQQGEFSETDFAIPELNRPESVNRWHSRFQIVQPLFHSVSDWKNRSSAQHHLAAEEARHQFLVSQLKLEISKLYYSYVALSSHLMVVREGIEWLKKLEKGYELMSAPTAANTTNFLIAQSVRLGLESQQSELEVNQKNLMRNLISRVGYPSNTDWILVDRLPLVSSGWLEGFEENKTQRWDLQALKEETQAAKFSLQASKATWGPNLDLLGGYNLYTGKYDSWQDSFDVNVLLVWPFFQGPRVGQIQSSKARLEGVLQSQRALELAQETSMKNAQESLSARIHEYELSKEAGKKADEAMNIAKKRYAQGTLPLFDYSQSIQNWVSMKRLVICAQQRVAEAQEEFKFEKGNL